VGEAGANELVKAGISDLRLNGLDDVAAVALVDALAPDLGFASRPTRVRGQVGSLADYGTSAAGEGLGGMGAVVGTTAEALGTLVAGAAVEMATGGETDVVVTAAGVAAGLATGDGTGVTAGLGVGDGTGVAAGLATGDGTGVTAGLITDDRTCGVAGVVASDGVTLGATAGVTTPVGSCSDPGAAATGIGVAASATSLGDVGATAGVAPMTASTISESGAAAPGAVCESGAAAPGAVCESGAAAPGAVCESSGAAAPGAG
jgi:hypothetical protein